MGRRITIKTIFKFKRGNAATWKAKNPILEDGEPGFVLDQNKLKIGDGITAWNDLPFIAGGSDIPIPIVIEDPENGQVLMYDENTETWRNVNLTDDKSIIYLDSEGLGIKGYKEAEQGFMLVKDKSRGIAWVKPVDDTALRKAIVAADAAAERASASAIESGNQAVTAGLSADKARETLVEVNRKIWFGTMAEYNALEVVYDDSIYCIIDED